VKPYGHLLLVAGFFALTACQSASKPASDTTTQDAAADTCGASQYQNYVGKPLSSLSSQHFATPVRAIPWNAAVTMDFNLHRLNFLADKSGKISKVYCG
jgi:Peptidase inhibitor I78 family